VAHSQTFGNGYRPNRRERMPEKDKGKAKREIQTSPEDYPVSSPHSFPSGDYSYTLEAVMGMQATLGKLTEAIDTLKGSIKAQGEKLDSVARDVHTAKVVMWVVIGIISFLGTVGGIALKALFDYFLRTRAPQK
jgi:hypothetical protein